MRNLDSSLETTWRNDLLYLTLAAGLHVLLFMWDPILIKSDFHTVHDFVSVDVVESAGSPLLQEAPAKMSLMDTLKDMLLKPKTDEIAHVAPEMPSQPAAAPAQNVLKEATRRPIAMNFQPQTQSEDLAALKNPDQIKAPGPNVPNMPVGGPTLTSKSFGGIRLKDVPFQVSGPDSIAEGQVSNIPIAIGNSSAKSGLGYTGPTLQDASKRRVGIVPGASGTGADTMALASAAPTPIALGTGGSGVAPTGPATGGGGSLQERGGGGSGGGLVGRAMFGSGTGTGIGAGIEGMPSAAQELDSQLGQGSGSNKTAKHQGFEIAGPLTNRGINYKVIPEYPAWAEEQGIMGSVRLYFTVDAQGNVRSYIRVTKTTGYPALDQLGIDALKKWKFAPLSQEDEGKGEWGIITFNFSLSS